MAAYWDKLRARVTEPAVEKIDVPQWETVYLRAMPSKEYSAQVEIVARLREQNEAAFFVERMVAAAWCDEAGDAIDFGERLTAVLDWPPGVTRYLWREVQRINRLGEEEWEKTAKNSEPAGSAGD